MDLYSESDQHKNLTTFRGSLVPFPWFPSLVDIYQRVCELSCTQTDRHTDIQTHMFT